MSNTIATTADAAPCSSPSLETPDADNADNVVAPINSSVNSSVNSASLTLNERKRSATSSETHQRKRKKKQKEKVTHRSWSVNGEVSEVIHQLETKETEEETHKLETHVQEFDSQIMLAREMKQVYQVWNFHQSVASDTSFLQFAFQERISHLTAAIYGTFLPPSVSSHELTTDEEELQKLRDKKEDDLIGRLLLQPLEKSVADGYSEQLIHYRIVENQLLLFHGPGGNLLQSASCFAAASSFSSSSSPSPFPVIKAPPLPRMTAILSYIDQNDKLKPYSPQPLLLPPPKGTSSTSSSSASTMPIKYTPGFLLCRFLCVSNQMCYKNSMPYIDIPINEFILRGVRDVSYMNLVKYTYENQFASEHAKDMEQVYAEIAEMA
jgi:hypothetical protein